MIVRKLVLSIGVVLLAAAAIGSMSDDAIVAPFLPDSLVCNRNRCTSPSTPRITRSAHNRITPRVENAVKHRLASFSS